MHDIVEALWVVKNVCLAVAALAIVFYTGWYFLLANWRKYLAGRRVLGFTTSLVAVLGYTIIALFDGNKFLTYPEDDPSLYRVILGTIVYGSVAYSAVLLNITLIKAWGKGESDPTRQNPFIPDERTDRRIMRSAKHHK